MGYWGRDDEYERTGEKRTFVIHTFDYDAMYFNIRSIDIFGKKVIELGHFFRCGLADLLLDYSKAR